MPAIRVIARRPIRRGGRKWGVNPVTVDVSEIKPHQLEQILNEPLLIVTHVPDSVFAPAPGISNAPQAGAAEGSQAVPTDPAPADAGQAPAPDADNGKAGKGS